MSDQHKASIKLHTLDISQPISQQSSLASLAETCKTWGFFHITNHGISSSLYAEICAMSRELFGLPLETKLNLTKAYTPHFIASPFFESLRVSGPDFFASAQSSARVVLVDQHKRSIFSELLEEYGRKMAELSKKIMRILLMSLGHGFDTKYEAEFKDCHGYLRVNNYSSPEPNTDNNDDIEGLGKHTDMSCVTIVWQDALGGLQVRSEDGAKWVDVRPCDGALLVNVGDMLQAWSNERLRSSEHRVVLRGRGPEGRFSLAFFWCFKDDKVVVAPEEVVGLGAERAYEPFVCAEYLGFRENDERGKFEKVGFTVRDFAGLKRQVLIN